ncbi:MAG: UvrD-helicase domain-containing protein, partial [Prochlorococcus sp.]
MDRETQDQDIVFQPNDYPLTPGLRLLEASAGTGKTFALAHLVLRLLTEGQHPWGEILVVTFTDAAAAELRDRIGKRLEAALEGLEAINLQHQPRQQPQPIDPVLTDWLERLGGDQQLRHRWASVLLEALESLDRADITTIHGFCRRTLRRQALESGAAMDPRIEGEGQQLVLEVVHDYWQQEILTLAPEQVRGLQAAGLSTTNLAKALLRIDSDPGLAIEQSSARLAPSQSLASQFEDWLEQQWQAFISHWRSQGKDLEADFCSRASEWRNQGASSAEIRPFSVRPKSDRCAAMDQWLQSFAGKTSDDGQIPCPGYGAIRDQKKLLAEYFHPAIWCRTSRRCGEQKPVLSRPRLQEAIAQLWDGPAEQVWNHGLRRGLDELAERRRKKGVISYGGLLAALDPARGKAEEKPVWIDLLRDRYRVALIDEFQDTDPLQWRLLEQTFGQSKDHLLLMVGDPKQAIYRFRGGDLNTYIKARASCQRIDVLRDNYRATAPLMEALNRLMATGMSRSGLDVPALTPKSDAPPLPKQRSPLQLINLDAHAKLDPQAKDESTPEPEPLSKTAIEKQIPTAVANVVLELLQTTTELQPAEICLLVASHRQAADLRTSLGQNGLPTRLVSQGDVLSSEAAEVLQRFLDCLAEPGQTARLRLVACSALLQWNTEQLRKAEASGALDQLALRFQRWAENLPRLGLQGCLAQLLEGRTMADLSERGRLLGDLNQCAQLTQEAMHEQGLDAASAADWLRRQRLQPVEVVPDHRQPHSDIAESAVAVVTVHRSKGLEYPVVICPYLWEAPGDEDGPLWRVAPTQNWCIAINKNWGRGWDVAEQTHQDRLQEAERLAYVAMTRARRQLILFWARGQREQGNPLTNWLFGPQSIEAPMAELTRKRMDHWLREQKVPIS